jgi:hypothetical protein
VSELLFGFDEQIAAWVAERIPHVRGGSFGPCAAIGVISGDRLLAGVVFHALQPDYQTMQLSMAAGSPMWARRDIVAGLLHYAFEQNPVYSLNTVTPPENEAALKVNKHIGLQRKTIIPHYFGKKRHAVVCQMTKPEYLKAYAHG